MSMRRFPPTVKARGSAPPLPDHIKPELHRLARMLTRIGDDGERVRSIAEIAAAKVYEKRGFVCMEVVEPEVRRVVRAWQGVCDEIRNAG